MSVLRTAILEMCRRRKEEAFSPSEVVRQLFPQDWQMFMPDVLEEMMHMYREGLIEVSLNGKPVHLETVPEGSVRIVRKSKPKRN